MKEKTSKLKKSQKKKLGAIFLRGVVITFTVCVVLLGAAAGAYRFFIYDDGEAGSVFKYNPMAKKTRDINQTIAIFGVDKDGYRTDVIFVLNYNSKTNKAKVVSIPRDTKVTWSDMQKQKLQEYKGTNISISKLNEMTSYGGIENIRAFTIDEIERMLGIKVDHYAIVTIDAFRQIVDAVGGVEVDVPALDGKGLHYDDNAQNLHIHLNPGLQVLDGKQAEGLVRFRKGYAEGDVGRIKTQQIFLKAFAKKVLSPATLSKIPQIVPVIFTSVKTDLPLTEIPGYYGYLNKFDLTNLSFDIIPGEAEHQGSKWYFVANKSEMPAFINRIFFEEPSVSGDLAAVIEDKTVTIEILNGTTIKGAAGKAKDELEKLGYNVERIDNYEDNNMQSTIIYAKDISKAKQFQNYYNGAVIQQSSSITYDIQIILGSGID